jgi:hypothetical protein
MKKIDHKNMSARGFITAAIRVLKLAGMPIAKLPRTSCWGHHGENVEGAHISRVGLSRTVSVDYYHPLQSRTFDPSIREHCRAKRTEIIAILEAHGVEFNTQNWVDCFAP